jgi:hypothetical protein
MTKRSKYATLDAVIVDEMRRDPRGHSPTGIRTRRVQAFALKVTYPGDSWWTLVGARLQRLRLRGVVVTNGISGDGCRWFAAP